MKRLDNHFSFQWDKGNLDKNPIKHGITPTQAEEIFTDENLQVNPDIKHSQTESRFIGIGKTTENQILFTIFTFRNNHIRIISSRLTNKKERTLYETQIA